MDDRTVINLSERLLPEDEIVVLGKGLTFCPDSDFDYAQTRIDVFKYIRKLKLKKIYAMKRDRRTATPTTQEDMVELTCNDMETLRTLHILNEELPENVDGSMQDDTEQGWLEDMGVTQIGARTKFKPKTTFMPQTCYDAIDTFHEVVIKELKKLADTGSVESLTSSNQKKKNFSQRHWQAVKDLRADPTIIIKPSDKGGNVVVLSKKLYEQEALRQLSDSTCYEKITKEQYRTTERKYGDLIQKWYEKGLLDIEEFLYLQSKNAVIPTFYHIPKIHKDSKKPPGRPIVSSKGSLLEHMSVFVDYFLFPFVQDLSSYVRDTTDFINKIQDIPWEDGLVLVVLDVANLYTSISHEQGMSACEYFLRSRSLSLYQHNRMIMEFLCFCLTENIFMFGEQLYRQKQETAMGTCFAPSYANLFVGWWEKQVAWSGRNEKYMDHVMLWCRYIDDLFLVWRGSVEEVKEYILELNNNDLNLRFTSVVSDKCIDYLDVTVLVDGESLKTILFRKPTAGNSILHGTSGHPKSLLDSIPYGELLRAKRNCTKQEDYEKVESQMLERMKKRGYPINVLSRAKDKVKGDTQRSLLMGQKKVREDSTKIRLITTYSRDVVKVNNILRRNWHILKTDPVIGSEVGTRPQVTYKKNTALRDLLVSSHFKEETKRGFKQIHGFFPCMACKACKFSKKRTSVEVLGQSKPMSINKMMNCNTDFVVYCLECPCGMKYVGSTIKKAKCRILEHMRAIAKNDQAYPVARHYFEFHRGNRDLVSFFCIDRVEANPRGGDRVRLLRQMESRYILLLNTKIPEGLNAEEELVVHI